MRRLIKLRGEVIIIAMLSIVIGWGISAVMVNTYYKSNYGQKAVENMAFKRNQEDIGYIKITLDIENADEEYIIDRLRDKDNFQRTSSSYTIYLTDLQGNVIESTSDLKVDKITLEKEDSFKIEKDLSKFTGKNFIRVLNDRYVVLINEGYCRDDTFNLVICLFMIIIVFLVLIRGRVKYINTIAYEVREIAKGDLSKRVTAKYKNELSDLAKDINFMTEEIENQDTKQKEFITNISHDLRTPLTTIMGYLKMIEEEKYSNNDELQRYVAIASKKGRYLNRLLEDFFRYSKLASNDVEIESLEINLNNCIREMILEEEVNFTEGSLVVNSEISEEKLLINGDPILIGRVFENLIGNSIKYSKKNTEVDIKLKKEVINNKGYGVFSISNIPKEELSDKEVDKFFDRLYKKNSARSEGGSGLGLAISQEIVKNHSGFITVRKAGGKIVFKVGFRLE